MTEVSRTLKFPVHLDITNNEFQRLVKATGLSLSKASIKLGKGKNYIQQSMYGRSKANPMLVKRFFELVGEEVYAIGFVAVEKNRENDEALKQARLENEAKKLRLKEEKAALRRAKRQARRNRPAL
ncbi:MAG: hypothetical protein KAH48_04180 [Chlorobi bacterium]|nr:hypothetical protein [Chlorobiota bacterium]